MAYFIRKSRSSKSSNVIPLRDLVWMQSNGITNYNPENNKRSVHREPVPLKSAFRTWIPFCDETTIHGLRFAFGAAPRHRITRLVWAVAFLVMCSLCVAICWNTVMKYLEYKVKTTMYVNDNVDVEFPALTFSNENLFLKSVVGSSATFLEGVVPFIADSMEEYSRLLPRVLRMCHNPQEKTNLTDELNWGSKFYVKYGLSGAMKFTTPDSVYSVKKCWWAGNEENCSNLFLNHATDFGWSFTFNPSYGLVLDTLDRETYGIDIDTYKMKTVPYVGFKNGIELLINIGEDDYCVTRGDLSVGLRVVVHDSHVQPLFLMSHPISLAPGFSTSIGVKITNIVRYTSNLGKCVEFQALPLYPNVTTYYKEQCYLDCFTKFVYDRCKCYPFFGPPFAQVELRRLRNLSDYIAACYGLSLICLKQTWTQFIHSAVKQSCPLCIDPCNDTLYTVEISNQRFPAYSSAPVLFDVFGINKTVDEWRRNYLKVTVYVQGLHVLSIEESQDFTLNDLYANVGGVLGLFLGMSFLSFGEVFHQLLVFFLSLSRTIYSSSLNKK